METPFVAHGHITLSNTGGILVMINRNGDGVRYKFVTDSEDVEEFESEIFYEPDPENEDGTLAYFVHGDTRYYLNDVMRISN